MKLWAMDPMADASVISFAETQPADPVTDAFLRFGSVAAIPVYDVLFHTALFERSYWYGVTEYRGINAAIDQAAEDDTITDVVFLINSPGGMVQGLNDTVGRIRTRLADKSVTAIVDGDAHSAAYFIASAADYIVVGQDGAVGSIGAIVRHFDISKSLEQEGIEVTTIRSPEGKQAVNPYEALSDEAKAALQSEIDGVAANFAARVAEFRGISVDSVIGTNAASISAKRALALGLIDEIADPSAYFDNLVTKLSTGIEDPSDVVGHITGDDMSDQDNGGETITAKEDGAPDIQAALREQEAQIRAEMHEKAEAEKARAASIVAACDRAKMPELAGTYIAGGMSADQVNADLVGKLADATAGVEVDLSQGDKSPKAPSSAEVWAGSRKRTGVEA